MEPVVIGSFRCGSAQPLRRCAWRSPTSPRVVRRVDRSIRGAAIFFCAGARDEIGLGAGCWGHDPATKQSICVAHCTGTVADPLCPPETGCPLDPGGYLAVCLPICDPLLQDCGAGLSCVPGVDSFVCLEDMSGGAGQALDGCTGLEFCDPGQLCFDSAQLPGCENKEACCTPYCDLGDPACPVPGTTCEPLFARGEAPPGAADVGVCVLP